MILKYKKIYNSANIYKNSYYLTCSYIIDKNILIFFVNQSLIFKGNYQSKSDFRKRI